LRSVALGCILLLESRARMLRCFSLASSCKTEAKSGGKYKAVRGNDDDVRRHDEALRNPSR
jgi:hypothetical protein